ncbi:flavodoxin domain-containing protein [Lacticaseibacillus paracasei]
MEQALVVYASETGFTQRFALGIAQALHCELIDVQFVTTADLQKRKLIIYGGHLVGYGGHLVGEKVLGLKAFYREFHQSLPDQLIVFGSGIIRREQVAIKQIKLQYQNRCVMPIDFYYLQGQPKLSQMNLFRRIQTSLALKQLGASHCPAIHETIQPLLRAVVRLLDQAKL